MDEKLRRRFQFSLRSLFLLTATLAIACAALAPVYREYQIEQVKLYERQQESDKFWKNAYNRPPPGSGFAELRNDDFPGEGN